MNIPDPTPEQIELMKKYVRAIKRARAIIIELEDFAKDEMPFVFLFGSILSFWPYVKQEENLPEDAPIDPSRAVAIGDHLANILPMLALTLGMIKDDAMLDQLERGENVYVDLDGPQTAH